MSRIGLLHPGEMGISIAAAAINNGHHVYWVPEGRSEKTRGRAEQYDLIELASLQELGQASQLILSVCPPDAAEDVSGSVVEAGFRGLYVDANAISPQRTIRIGGRLAESGIQYVDGSIIGGPAWEPKSTWLYLSGTDAAAVAGCFSKGPLETRIVGDRPGKASALKMCYAAYTKGTSALLAAILATAKSFDVGEELYEQWDQDDEGFSGQVSRRVARVTRKAWRFEGEMKEIADTFTEAGLPDGFHRAAAEVYRRMALYKDGPEKPGLDEVLYTLLSK